MVHLFILFLARKKTIENYLTVWVWLIKYIYINKTEVEGTNNQKIVIVQSDSSQN